MPEIQLLTIDKRTGVALVDDEGPIGRAAQAALAPLLGQAEAIGCARPQRGRKQQLPAAAEGATNTVQLAGYWHDSLIEGPGRRSVAQFQGCPIRCVGCWVPETWKLDGGRTVEVEQLAAALLDSAYHRDGVTIIGGEPFAQPQALANLLVALRNIQPGVHVTCYTGYRYETLRADMQARGFAFIFELINCLIDGPYAEKQTATAGAWTGSGNQRVIEL